MYGFIVSYVCIYVAPWSCEAQHFVPLYVPTCSGMTIKLNLNLNTSKNVFEPNHLPFVKCFTLQFLSFNLCLSLRVNNFTEKSGLQASAAHYHSTHRVRTFLGSVVEHCISSAKGCVFNSREHTY